MSLYYSIYFSHPSTNQTRPCLASEIRQDRAHSGWYIRRLFHVFLKHIPTCHTLLLSNTAYFPLRFIHVYYINLIKKTTCEWHCGVRKTRIHIHSQTWPFTRSHHQTSYPIHLSLRALIGRNGLWRLKTSQRGANRVSAGGDAYLGIAGSLIVDCSTFSASGSPSSPCVAFLLYAFFTLCIFTLALLLKCLTKNSGVGEFKKIIYIMIRIIFPLKYYSLLCTAISISLCFTYTYLSFPHLPYFLKEYWYHSFLLI